MEVHKFVITLEFRFVENLMETGQSAVVFLLFWNFLNDFKLILMILIGCFSANTNKIHRFLQFARTRN